MKRSLNDRGFTYIELLVVIALVAVVLSMSMGMSMDSIMRSQVTEERDQLVALVLMGARARALGNVDGTSHGVHIDNNNHTYTLFDGESYDKDVATNRVIPFVSDTFSITHQHGVADIIFKQLSGNVVHGTGTIVISDGILRQEVTLNAVGQIEW